MITGSSSLNFFQVVFTQVVAQFTAYARGKHVTGVAEGSYHLQLIRSDLNFTLRYAVNRASSYAALCTPTSVVQVNHRLVITRDCVSGTL